MIAEQEMTPIIRDHFVSPNYVRFEEFNILGKRIDILFVRDDHRQIISIELKVRNWRTGLHQCIQNKLFSNKSYLAIWHEFLDRIPMASFDKEGIGVISVFSGRVEVVLEAKKRDIPVKEILRLVRVEEPNVGGIIDG